MGYATTVYVSGRESRRDPSIEPLSALVVSRISPSNQTVLSQHRIQAGRLDAGTLIGPQQLPQVLQQLGMARGIDWIDDRVLASGPGGLVWYQPGAVRPMHWRINTKSHRLRVLWPTLVFRMSYAGDFRIWAVAESERPGLDTPLFHAPIGNVYDDARMCWGSVPVPVFQARERAAFESAVFDSAFTHHNHLGVLAGFTKDSDLFAAWRAFGAAGVPRERLASTGLTLRKALT